MAISWIITTIFTCFVAFVIEYVGDSSDFTILAIASGLLTILVINTVFWLPITSYLHKRQNISLLSSLASSIFAAAIGSVVSIGAIILLMNLASTIDATGYVDWKIGHVHAARIILLWGINGLIFWVLYGKFAANK
jgi:ABC-type siderophore export system fused ATPase/permease subunit